METQQLAAEGIAEACASVMPIAGAAEGEGEALQVAAVIGFAGDQLRGTIALAAGLSGLQQQCAHSGAGDAPAEDCLGETANMIAGQVKRTFAKYGQVVTITPPIVVRGVTIEVCGSGTSDRVEHVWRNGDGSMTAWLDYEAADDIEFVEQAADESIEQGEGLFF